MKIIDISVPTSVKTTVFPGDPAPIIHWPGWTHEKGNPANVGFFNGGLHHGTHVDAPWHFIPGGKKIDELPLDIWVGPAEVVDLQHATASVTATDLESAKLPRGARRLLFKTRNGQSDYWREPWNPDFIHIDESAAQWCKDHGILLVGLDYLTIDPPSRPDFPSHLILLGNGIVILENIVLRDVAPGSYTLHAAPINIHGADGAWCRAYLTPGGISTAYHQGYRPMSRFYVYRICLVATLGGLLFGYDTAVISGAVDALKVHFHLGALPLGWVVGSALIGCIIGVLIAGRLTDWAGRRSVLMLSAVLFLISALACTVTHTSGELVIARIIGGIGVGMASLISPLYIAELSPARIRGALVSLNQIAILVGMVLSYLANAWIASLGDAAWLTETGWRIMLGAMSVPAVLFLLFTLTIPESPRWLLKRGRDSQARDILIRINNDAETVDREIEVIRDAIQHEQASVSELFRPGTVGVVVMTMVLALFQAITGINVVMYYAPTIFTSAGIGTGTALSHSVIIGLVMMAFTVLSMFLVDRVGRKPIMLIASAGMGTSLALLGLGFARAGASGWGLLIWILTYVASFSIGMGGIYWVVVTEVFPTRVRGVATSLSVVFLWGGNFLVSQFFPAMLEALAGRVFYVFAFMCLICFFFILWCVPETKGKSLEQIEHDLFKV